MTHDDDLGPGSDEHDPWAPGGAMSTTPIPPPAVFFEPLVEAPDPVGAPRAGQPDGADRRAAHIEVFSLSRRAQIGIGLVVAVVLVAAGVWLVGRNRGAVEPAADPAPPTSLFNPPETTIAEPADAIEDPPAVDEVARLDTVTEMPAALASLGATELVVLTAGGEVVVVDTSSGSVRSTPSEAPFGSPHLAVTDNVELLWSSESESIVVFRRNAEPAVLDTGAAIAGVVAEGDDEFLLRPAAGAGQAYELRTEPVVRTVQAFFPVGDPESARAHPTGDLMVSGDDGTYRLDSAGPELISAGYVVADGRNHVLFRDCSIDAGCALVLDDVRAGGTFQLPAVDDWIDPGESSYWLSPDGTTLAGFAFTDGGPVVRFLDLLNGDRVEAPAEPAARPPMLSWSPDSSGAFALDDGAVVFFDRDSGQISELTALNELLAPAGGAQELAVRPASEMAAIRGGVLTAGLSGPTNLDLVALTNDGDIVDLDLDTGGYTVRPGLSLQAGGSRYLFADEAGVTVASYASLPGFRLDDGGRPQPTVGDSISGDVYPGPRLGTLWVTRRLPAGSVDYEAVDLAGRPLGDRIELDDAFVLGSDGAGALIVTAVGGNYVATPAGVNRLTAGALIASGPTTVYARECDEVFTCQLVRIDRVTGERAPIDDPTLVGAPLFQQNLQLTGRSVSPDGDVVLVQKAQNGLTWSIVDVAAGVAVGVPGPQDDSSVVWSDDSQFAVYLSGGRLRVYDRLAATLVEIDDIPDVRAFTARP